MASVRFVLCGVVAAVLAVCATPAHANDGPATMSGTIELTPVTSRPGAEVQLRISGCASNRATATSEAFVTDARLTKDSAGMFAEATVRETMAAGTYPVRINCAGVDSTAEGKLTIVTDGRELPGRHFDGLSDVPSDRTGDDHAGRTDQAGREPHTPYVSPVAPVPAGGGGTRHVAAAEAPDTAGLVLAGTTAAIAGGLIWYRRRTNAQQRRQQQR
ncbi:hypothetical protein [Streptomyces sp. NPDC053048]|uniref:hypothetical protein n=1 Tax=Streptomyces sp. NPDC053048 TaxID=3365694 RepID=UPI0037D0F53D